MSAKMVVSALGMVAFVSIPLSSTFGQGQVFWQENGVLICDGTREGYVSIAEDGVGGAIISWADERNGGSIYAQRVDSSGGCLWMPNGVEVYSPSLFPRNLKSVSDQRGGAIIVWEHFYGGEQGIYAARVDGNGIVWWAIPVCVSDSMQWYPSITSDGAEGAVISWVDGRSGSSDIYAQRIDSSGVPRWASGGISVCSLDSASLWPEVVNHGCSGATITWSDYRGGDWDIYAQRVDSSGITQWTINGVPICTADSIQDIPLIVDSEDGAIIVWTDKRSGDWDIYGQRVDADGVTQWSLNGIAICMESGGQGGYGTGTKLVIEEDGCEGAVVCWRDWRRGSHEHDIYAQRVDSDGILLWADTSVFICTAADPSQESMKFGIESDGRSGAVIAWTDYRAGNWDIYSQRVDSTGVLKWGADGLAACTNSAYQGGPVLIRDGEAGAIVAWDDNRSGGCVYAQRVGDLVGVEEKLDVKTQRQEVTLTRSMPNPFVSAATIEYLLTDPTEVLLKVYKVSGGLVKTLVDGRKGAGRHRVVWDGRDDRGKRCVSGVYFYRLEVRDSILVKKMVLVY